MSSHDWYLEWENQDGYPSSTVWTRTKDLQLPKQVRRNSSSDWPDDISFWSVWCLKYVTRKMKEQKRGPVNCSVVSFDRNRQPINWRFVRKAAAREGVDTCSRAGCPWTREAFGRVVSQSLASFLLIIKWHKYTIYYISECYPFIVQLLADFNYTMASAKHPLSPMCYFDYRALAAVITPQKRLEYIVVLRVN